MTHEYGPYRPEEALPAPRWEYDDYEGLWVQVDTVPAWLHEQREAINRCAISAGSASSQPTTGRSAPADASSAFSTSPARSTRPREIDQVLDRPCRCCGAPLRTRTNRRARVCPTCILLGRLPASQTPS